MVKYAKPSHSWSARGSNNPTLRAFAYAALASTDALRNRLTLKGRLTVKEVETMPREQLVDAYVEMYLAEQ